MVHWCELQHACKKGKQTNTALICQVRNFTFCNPVVQLACSTQCFTRSASAQQLHIPHSRINIQKFCPRLPSLENIIGTISPFLFAINHRKSCSKRHLKNIILLNIDLSACVLESMSVCVLMNNKTTKE